MGARGRKSAADLMAIRPAAVARLEPRADAPADVRAIFEEIIVSVAADHFRPADAHLVEQYAQAIALGHAAYEALSADGLVTVVAEGKTSPWIVVLEKAHRSAVALSARLRLCPQTRIGGRAADRTTRPQYTPPWEFKG